MHRPTQQSNWRNSYFMNFDKANFAFCTRAKVASFLKIKPYMYYGKANVACRTIDKANVANVAQGRRSPHS